MEYLVGSTLDKLNNSPKSMYWSAQILCLILSATCDPKLFVTLWNVPPWLAVGASWPPNKEVIVTPDRPGMVATSLSLAAFTSVEELQGCEAEPGVCEEMPAACNPCSTEVVIVVTRWGSVWLRRLDNFMACSQRSRHLDSLWQHLSWGIFIQLGTLCFRSWTCAGRALLGRYT